MTVTIPYQKKSRAEVVSIIDKAADELFALGEAGHVDLVDPKKQWTGSVMTFSVTAAIGFINIPLNGSIEVTDTTVIVICELPAMVEKFVGNDKVRHGIEEKMAGLLTA